MALDITPAVGDGARRMTYDELAQARGVPLASARIVPRAISRNSAETPDFSDPLKTRNSVLAGKIQGNSSILASDIRIFHRKH